MICDKSDYLDRLLTLSSRPSAPIPHITLSSPSSSFLPFLARLTFSSRASSHFPLPHDLFFFPSPFVSRFFFSSFRALSSLFLFCKYLIETVSRVYHYYLVLFARPFLTIFIYFFPCGFHQRFLFRVSFFSLFVMVSDRCNRFPCYFLALLPIVNNLQLPYQFIYYIFLSSLPPLFSNPSFFV